jgi:hypothetical protein
MRLDISSHSVRLGGERSGYGCSQSSAGVGSFAHSFAAGVVTL